MSEAMRRTVAGLLNGSNRYNMSNIPTLEHYVKVQVEENTYDLEANLALLKLYQLQNEYDIKLVALIMIKAITNFPHTDFVLCKCLLNEDVCREPTIKAIMDLAELLECCHFREFWYSLAEVKKHMAGFNGFETSVRKFVCHVVGITFQTISKRYLCAILGNIDETAVKYWIQKYGWEDLKNGKVFVANQEDKIKSRKIAENIEYESLLPIIELASRCTS